MTPTRLLHGRPHLLVGLLQLLLQLFRRQACGPAPAQQAGGLDLTAPVLTDLLH